MSAPMAPQSRAGPRQPVAGEAMTSAADPLITLRRQRHVKALHRLGPRAVHELLDEIARVHGIAADIDQRLAAYAAIDPEKLRLAGGDRFAPAPLRIIGGRR